MKTIIGYDTRVAVRLLASAKVVLRTLTNSLHDKEVNADKHLEPGHVRLENASCCARKEGRNPYMLMLRKKLIEDGD